MSCRGEELKIILFIPFVRNSEEDGEEEPNGNIFYKISF